MIWKGKKLETAGQIMDALADTYSKAEAQKFAMEYVRTCPEFGLENLRLGLSRFMSRGRALELSSYLDYEQLQLASEIAILQKEKSTLAEALKQLCFQVETEIPNLGRYQALDFCSKSLHYSAQRARETLESVTNKEGKKTP